MAERRVARIGRYVIGKTIGEGTFGKVKLGTHELTGHKVAVKILNKKNIASSRKEHQIRREVTIMKMFWHPHIIRLYEEIDTPTDIFLIMEYEKAGEMFEYIVRHGRLAEAEARRVFQQLISGVDYCHRNGVVHRDLKPENLLIDAHGDIKIGDFGLSNVITDGDLFKTSCGSPNYAAPEVISGKLYAGPEVDVWSAGVILYALVTGRLPFDEEHIPTLFRKIRQGKFPEPQHVSDECKSLIAGMLEVEPTNRLTVPEIRQHAWFQTDLPDYIARGFEQQWGRKIECVDEHLVSKVCDLLPGQPRDKIRNLLLKDDNNDAIVLYRLLEDGKARKSIDVPNIASNAARTPDILSTSSPSPATPAGLRSPPYASRLRRGVTPSTGAAGAASGRGAAWSLGIESSLRPSEIMLALYKAMRLADCEWAIADPFTVHCRPVVRGSQPRPAKGHAHDTKLTFQLFAIDETDQFAGYLLDVKMVSGGVFNFFTLAMRIRSNLRLDYD